MAERKLLEISDDVERGIITICGVRYSHEFFKTFGVCGFEVGSTFKVIERTQDGQPVIDLDPRAGE